MVTITTQEQREAIEKLRGNWARLGETQPTIGCNNAVAVECFYRSGHSMWVCIETDGYAHS